MVCSSRISSYTFDLLTIKVYHSHMFNTGTTQFAYTMGSKELLGLCNSIGQRLKNDSALVSVFLPVSNTSSSVLDMTIAMVSSR